MSETKARAAESQEAARRVLWVGCSTGCEWGFDGFSVDRVENGVDALRLLGSGAFDAMLITCPLTGMEVEELVAAASVPVVVHDLESSIEKAVRLMKLGAFHYGEASADATELVRYLELAAGKGGFRRMVQERKEAPWSKFLVSAGPAMERVENMIRLVAARRCTVLVTGETGTGKEMVARAIHVAGERRLQPMVAVNCSALPANLIEAELFGHVKGAFTDASRDRVGLFEQAHKGTIFLDEIGDMPLELQAKILRVLQDREFQRLGSSQTTRVDIRVIAATNVDLAERVRQGKFREDLYYRLNVVQIQVPALRERSGDIPALARYFVERFCAAESIPLKQITPDAFGRLTVGVWPGNVRQLENAVEQAVALSGTRELLHAFDFPVAGRTPAAQVVPISAPLPEGGLDFERIVGDFERQIIGEALAKTAGNKKQAADILKLKRTTLTAKLKSLQATA